MVFCRSTQSKYRVLSPVGRLCLQPPSQNKQTLQYTSGVQMVLLSQRPAERQVKEQNRLGAKTGSNLEIEHDSSAAVGKQPKRPKQAKGCLFSMRLARIGFPGYPLQLRYTSLRLSSHNQRHSMTGSEKIEKGDTVAWNWGGSSIQGEVSVIAIVTCS